MALYEHVYMARQDVTAPQVEALTEQLKSLIAAQGGSVSKVEASYSTSSERIQSSWWNMNPARNPTAFQSRR